MKKIDFDDMTRKFLLGENTSAAPSILSYVQALGEILNNFRYHTQKEGRLLEVAKQHVREITRQSKKLLDENKNLQEQLKVLEEIKDKEK